MIAEPTGSRDLKLNATSDGRKALKDVMNGENKTIIIGNLMAKFIEINNAGDASAVSGFFGVNSLV